MLNIIKNNFYRNINSKRRKNGKENKKAVIPAAGLGTRFLPATKAQPKEMLEMVRDISDMVNIHFIRQKEPRGLGHAILCAKSFVGNEPFAVLLGDDIVYNNQKPCLKQLIDCYGEYKTSVLGVQTVAPENVNKYGIVGGIQIEDRVYKVKELVEKPSIEEAPSNVAILGRYIITLKIFEILENTELGKGNEIQLTDALLKLIEEKK